MLSRLPLPVTSSKPQNAVNAFQIVYMPITAEELKEKTQKDKALSQVHRHCVQGKWPNKIGQDLKPYHDKRDELSIDNGIILWGLRVVVPTKYRPRIMQELHHTHPGIVRMKA